MPVTPTPLVTLTATFQDLSGGPSANSKIVITLAGYGSTAPSVGGVSLDPIVGPLPFSGGTITLPLYGNDVISPAGTFYAVALLDPNGSVTAVQNYRMVGNGTLSLAMLSPYDPNALPASAGIIYVNFATGLQGAPAAPTSLAGTYSAGTTYSASQAVLNPSDGTYYVSLVSNNVGHSPATSPLFWAPALAIAGPAGPPSTFLGPWVSGQTYSIGQAVSATDGSSYVSLQNNNLGNTPQSSAPWWGLQAKAGPPTVFTGAWASGTTYTVGQAAYYGGSSYVSLTNSNVGNNPSSSPSNWSLQALQGSVTVQQQHDQSDVLDLAVRPYGSNLLDLTKVISNHFYSIPSNQLVAYTGYSASALITVQPGDKIATNFGIPDGNIGFGWLDVNGGPISALPFPSTIGTPQIAPAGANYYQASFLPTDNISTAQIVRSNSTGTPIATGQYNPYLALISPVAITEIVAAQLASGSTPIHLAALPTPTTDLAVNQPDMFGSTTVVPLDSTIIQITMKAVAPWAATTMQVQILTPAASGSPVNCTVASVQTINIPANSGTGYQTLTLLAGVDFDYIPVLAGQIPTYRTLGLAVAYATGTAGGYWRNSNVGGGTYHNVGDVVNMTSASGATICFDCLIQAVLPAVNPLQVQDQVQAVVVPAINTAISEFEAAIASAPQKRTQLMNQGFTGSALPTGWTTSGSAWTVAGGYATSPASGQGYSAYIQSPQMYSAEQRTHRVLFSPLFQAFTIGFGAMGGNVSLVQFNNTTHTLSIMAGISTTPLVTTVVSPTLQVGTLYWLTATLDERSITVTIGDTLGGTILSVTLDENLTFNGSIPDLGLWADFTCVFAIAGQFRVYNVSVLANLYQPDIVCQGDSITYGPFCTLAQKWTEILKQTIPSKSLLACGKPGGDTNSVITRMSSEMSFLLPKYMVLLIGINDFGAGANLSQFQTNINTILTSAQSLGIKVVICCLCTNGTLQATVTSANNWIRTLPGSYSVVGCVRFDIATSTTTDGNTQDTSKFHSDLLHPNEIGAAAMAARFPIDAPMLYD